MQRLLAILIFTIPLLGLAGCGQTSGNGAPYPTGQPTFTANFDPTQQIIPFPDDLLFTGSTDGTLNIPVANPNDFSDPKVAMNALDGFSTIAPISTSFSIVADPATILPTQTIHVYEVTATPAGAVTGIVRELTTAEYKTSLSTSGKTLIIQPLHPLKPGTRYLVALTSGIKSASGLPLVPSSVFGLTKGAAPLVDATGKSAFSALTDAQAASLEPLRQLTQTYLAALGAAGVPAASVALAWTFKTQSINKVLARIRADSIATPANPANFLTVAKPPPTLNSLGVLTMTQFAQLAKAKNLNAAQFPNVASVVIGAVKIPYYLSSQGGMGPGGAVGVAPTTPPGAITSHFTMDPATGLPVVQSTQTVPFLMTIPNSPGPWPVVIFQHGFTVDKTVMFGAANTLAKAGFATIAIDAVLHGDRTFGLDLVTEAIDPTTRKWVVTANVPDGKPDSSGKWYLNLNYLLTFRDNIRQSVADLIHLTRLLEVQTMDVVNNTTGAPGADGIADLVVGPTRPIAYVGHSNGGILGTMLAAVEPTIKTFVLANPGGVYSNIALNSTEISPLVLAGLAAKGITPTGTPDKFQAFFVAAQTVLDDGDPINYGGLVAAAGKSILLFKQVGDRVVPNSSTDALAASMALKQVANNPAGANWPLGVVPFPFIGSGFTVFTQGTHSSFLRPDPPNLVGQDVFTEMQSEMANYLGSALTPQGATIVLGATPLPSGLGTIMQ